MTDLQLELQAALHTHLRAHFPKIEFDGRHLLVYHRGRCCVVSIYRDWLRVASLHTWGLDQVATTTRLDYNDPDLVPKVIALITG